jgi:hypothetical protein
MVTPYLHSWDMLSPTYKLMCHHIYNMQAWKEEPCYKEELSNLSLNERNSFLKFLTLFPPFRSKRQE